MSFTFIRHPSEFAVEEYSSKLILYGIHRDSLSLFLFLSRSHYGALCSSSRSDFLHRPRKWIFIGFFRPLVGGFLFENTSRYQMMSFEKTNFLQRIREVFEIF